MSDRCQMDGCRRKPTRTVEVYEGRDSDPAFTWSVCGPCDTAVRTGSRYATAVSFAIEA